MKRRTMSGPDIIAMMNRPMPFSHMRSAWLLLAVSALGLELAALWFQYGMRLDPCVMCVYERLAVIGILLAGLLGLLQPRWLMLRVAGYLLWAGRCRLGAAPRPEAYRHPGRQDGHA